MNKDPLSLLPAPQPGEIRIAVLDGEATFLAHLQESEVNAVLDAFEKRTKISENDRANQMVHASIRIGIAKALRQENAADTFTRVLAAGVLWLAMRHWKNGAEIVRGVKIMLREDKTPVITASIANPVPEGTMPDTAWAFMVGETIHDGREQLEKLDSEQVILVKQDED